MIIQLNKYPDNIAWAYRTVRLYFKMTKDKQIVKY